MHESCGILAVFVRMKVNTWGRGHRSRVIWLRWDSVTESNGELAGPPAVPLHPAEGIPQSCRPAGVPTASEHIQPAGT